ncbi:hypothetical protein Lqui_2513 [Legionella quinlivanii]|uniref:Uncharacterized protein n=1 Tax=Legionella quinlivanii TaxID=45073 RepID=A0A0W0XPQ3_9GAMM|nr:hypothetical protein [Legionella quinlivanii]KTD46588.1 hypothetical protein Lqui_2513 [Legionella quinlivanii]SEG08604.1 hypothetical protein SAMN02746093_01815 [Legionella quinlivanii DSM 21216]STY10277.1 Uncharacterised protein [Legionella quinlivanii]
MKIEIKKEDVSFINIIIDDKGNGLSHYRFATFHMRDGSHHQVEINELFYKHFFNNETNKREIILLDLLDSYGELLNEKTFKKIKSIAPLLISTDLEANWLQHFNKKEAFFKSIITEKRIKEVKIGSPFSSSPSIYNVTLVLDDNTEIWVEKSKTAKEITQEYTEFLNCKQLLQSWKYLSPLDEERFLFPKFNELSKKIDFIHFNRGSSKSNSRFIFHLENKTCFLPVQNEIKNVIVHLKNNEEFAFSFFNAQKIARLGLYFDKESLNDPEVVNYLSVEIKEKRQADLVLANQRKLFWNEKKLEFLCKFLDLFPITKLADHSITDPNAVNIVDEKNQVWQVNPVNDTGLVQLVYDTIMKKIEGYGDSQRDTLTLIEDINQRLPKTRQRNDLENDLLRLLQKGLASSIESTPTFKQLSLKRGITLFTQHDGAVTPSTGIEQSYGCN